MLLPGLHTVRSERGTERGATHEQVDRATDSRARALPLRPARCDEEAEGGERRPGRTSRRRAREAEERARRRPAKIGL